MAYDQDGRRTTTQFPVGATQTTSYTNAGQVSEIKGANSSGSTLTDYKYSYTTGTSDKSLVQTRVENDPTTGGANVTTTYGYDTLNRLSSAVASSGTSYYYAYDLDGNLVCSQTSGSCSGASSGSCTGSLAFVYNNDDALTCDTAGSFTYDANGNELTAPNPPTLTYDAENQMSSITQGGTTTNYSYTGADSSQRTAAGSTTFVPDGDNILASTTSGTTTYYTYDGQGNLIGFRTGSSSYYYLYDNQGSVMAVINASGTISDRYTYTPYGTQTITTSGVSNPIAFQSGYQDATGLIKYGTRYYNPADAAWTQQDPSGQEEGYVFDGDNPLDNADPSGGRSIPQPCKKGQYGACIRKLSGVVSLGCALTVGSLFTFVGEGPVLVRELSDAWQEAKSFARIVTSTAAKINLGASFGLDGGTALGNVSGC